jgi:hypothetical protein
MAKKAAKSRAASPLPAEVGSRKIRSVNSYSLSPRERIHGEGEVKLKSN